MNGGAGALWNGPRPWGRGISAAGRTPGGRVTADAGDAAGEGVAAGVAEDAVTAGDDATEGDTVFVDDVRAAGPHAALRVASKTASAVTSVLPSSVNGRACNVP